MTDSPLIPGLALILVGAWILWRERLHQSKLSARKPRNFAGINEDNLNRGLAPLLIVIGVVMTIAGLLWSFRA